MTTRRAPATAEREEALSAWIGHIDRMKAKLDAMRPMGAMELKRLQEEFVARYTYNTNAIEGNKLTLNETALVLQGLTIGEKPLKDHLEAVGHKQAFSYLMRTLENKEGLTEKTIKTLHSYVLLENELERGNYRTKGVRITGTEMELPPFDMVPRMMEELLDSISNTKMHPIETAAVAHVDFERIHPFMDGNGRTGRLLMNLLLMQEGYLPVDIKFKNRRDYYAAFQSFEDTHSHADMVALVAKHELDEIQQRLNLYAKSTDKKRLGAMDITRKPPGG